MRRSMAAFLRIKRAMDPLDEDAKARLRGHGCSDISSGGGGGSSCSSGSEHDPLSYLLHDFFLDSDESDCCRADADESIGASDGEDGGDLDGSLDGAIEEIGELLNAGCGRDPFRLRLVSDVAEAADALAALRSNVTGYRRAVMARLREAGYDAGLCKAKWKGSGKLVAGSYEYIDVVVAAADKGGGEEERRYIVDLAFAAEFEVARAAAEYQRVVAALPERMVARVEDVRRVVRVAARTARRSLKSRGLHVPPWRKEKYMLAKWFGAYRRTTNAVPASAGIMVVTADRGVCRAVGFEPMAAVINQSPAAARITST